MMRFGVCGGPEMWETAAKAGFDFIEMPVGGALQPLEGEDAFSASLASAAASPLPCEALNCFIPNNLKLVGPNIAMNALRQYAETVFERAKRLGVKTIVLGSGGARRVPDGFDKSLAFTQLADFCRLCAPLAQQNGVTVVVEPLNKMECNLLTTVGECAALVKEVGHPSLRLLVDSYHWLKDNDSRNDLVTNGGLLAHVHVATIPSRFPPGVEACPAIESFFTALIEGGYDGRISIEGKIPAPPTDLPQALTFLRSLLLRPR